jgi:hypothetical protein
MSGVPKRMNEAVVMGGAEEVVRPERVSTKGTTTYPFNDIAVGQHFFVSRAVASVREALKRWTESNKDAKAKRFEMWRTTREGKPVVVVKRTK